MDYREIEEFKILDNNIMDEIQQQLTDTIFQRIEASMKHNPYDQEIREITAIQNGDLPQLLKSWAEDYTGSIGTLAQTPLRHSRNHGIVLVTLASRAAMRSGVLPELVYSLSDIYIQEIEEAGTPDAAYALGRLAEYHYTTLVQEQKERATRTTPSKDPRIEQCKDYIFRHLHDKIKIEDIAQNLYLNKTYLCELFKQETGMTIGNYILREKVLLIQNMLTYSRYSYSEIAAYFGFSSQSHLGRQFKKATGMTLHQYRQKYGVKNMKSQLL